MKFIFIYTDNSQVPPLELFRVTQENTDVNAADATFKAATGIEALRKPQIGLAIERAEKKKRLTCAEFLAWREKQAALWASK
jgi:hypothetical protein